MIKCSDETKYKWVSKSKLEGWETNGQRWIYINSKKRPSLCRLISWLCSRTSFGNGRKDRTIFIANGSSASQEWDKERQQDFKSCSTPKFISTFKDRAKGGYL